MLAAEPVYQLRKRFIAWYEQAGCPEQVALFMRHESEGRLHCEVMVYFSPAAEAIAREAGATPCPAPSGYGLSLIEGSGELLV